MKLDIVTDRCVLTIGNTRLLVSMNTAIKFLDLLSKEDMLYFVNENYVKDPTTNNYGHIKVFEHVYANKISIEFMSHVEFLMREANMQEKT